MQSAKFNRGLVIINISMPDATGDAVPADVALGKTFSSALLIGAIGTNTNNATNTGDATTADVREGIVFSSATLTNVAGTSTLNSFVDAGVLSISGYTDSPQTFVDDAIALLQAVEIVPSFPGLHVINNAIVSSGAPIQPPQAFVECSSYQIGAAIKNEVGLDLSNKGITRFMTHYGDESAPQCWLLCGAYSGAGAPISFYGNELPTEDIDNILDNVANNGYATLNLNISGPLMGIPTPATPGTGDGSDFVENADITTLVTNGGTVIVQEYVNRVSGATQSVTYSP